MTRGDARGVDCWRQVPEGDTAVQSISFAPDACTLVAANTKGNCYFWNPKWVPCPAGVPVCE